MALKACDRFSNWYDPEIAAAMDRPSDVGKTFIRPLLDADQKATGNMWSIRSTDTRVRKSGALVLYGRALCPHAVQRKPNVTDGSRPNTSHLFTDCLSFPSRAILMVILS